MRWRYPVFLVLFFASSLLSGQASYRLKTRTAAEMEAAQRQVVGSFCRLDFDGARLSNDGWQRVRQFMYDKRSPEFRSVAIVSRYQIAPAVSESRSPFVNVAYTMVGRFDPIDGFVLNTGIQHVVFRVEDKSGEIVITELEPNVPRVSKRAATQWLKTRLTSVEDPVEKAVIERALKTLEPPTSPAGIPGATTAEAPASEAK